MEGSSALSLVRLATCALLVGACGPTTEVYQAQVTRSAGLTLADSNVEVDVEECRGASGAPGSPYVPGFVEVGPDCLLPIRFFRAPGQAAYEARFSLVGGPYRCTLAAEPLSIRGVFGETSGAVVRNVDGEISGTDSVKLVVESTRATIELRGGHDTTRPSRMLCDLPSPAYTP